MPCIRKARELDRNLYHVDDVLTVKFCDEDIPLAGMVERDSFGRLFLSFGDGSVAYDGFQILGS